MCSICLLYTSSTFTYVAGEEGLLLDVDGSVEAILNYIENEWDYIEGSVDLPVEIDEPRGTEEELSKVQDELGTCLLYKSRCV